MIRTLRHAAYGAAAYVGLWALGAAVLFGYEETWTGPDGAFYTLGSMTLVEQGAYVVVRYVLAFPAWPWQWVGEGAVLHPLAPLASGAFVGAVVGWAAARRRRSVPA